MDLVTTLDASIRVTESLRLAKRNRINPLCPCNKTEENYALTSACAIRIDLGSATHRLCEFLVASVRDTSTRLNDDDTARMTDWLHYDEGGKLFALLHQTYYK